MINDMKTLGVDQGVGSNASNLVCVANEDRFDNTFMSEPLTAYAVGQPDNGVRALLDSAFPEVPVARKFEFRKAVAGEAYIAETGIDIRALGAEFKQLQFSGDMEQSKTLNKGLTVKLDKDEIIPGDEERKVAMLMNMLERLELRRGLAIIDAAASNTGKTWNSSADPDMDMLAAVEAFGDATGQDANFALIGSTSMQKRITAYRAQATAGGFASSAMTIQQIADFLGIDELVKVTERYRAGKGKSLSRFVSNYVYFYARSLFADREDPSSVKRFVTRMAEGRYRVYRIEKAKSVELSVEHYSNIVATNATGVQKLTIS